MGGSDTLRDAGGDRLATIGLFMNDAPPPPPPSDRTVAVFLSARGTAPAAVTEAAAALGEGLAQAGLGVVCGGAWGGPLGALIRAASGAGGHTVGVVTPTMGPDGMVADALSEVVVAPTICMRKATMAARSGRTVVLPGGIGTLDELFSALAEARLSGGDAPLLLWNVGGLYDGLIGVFDGLVAAGLIGDLPSGSVVHGGADRVGDVVAWAGGARGGDREGP